MFGPAVRYLHTCCVRTLGTLIMPSFGR